MDNGRGFMRLWNNNFSPAAPGEVLIRQFALQCSIMSYLILDWKEFFQFLLMSFIFLYYFHASANLIGLFDKSI